MVPDPIPQSGIDEAVQLMKTGLLYRYNSKDARSLVVSMRKLKIAQYTGHKYCIALNSCGSAIMLMMKRAGSCAMHLHSGLYQTLLSMRGERCVDNTEVSGGTFT